MFTASRGSLLLLLLGGLLLPGSALAATAPAGRALGANVFLLPQLVETSFPLTSFGLRLGVDFRRSAGLGADLGDALGTVIDRRADRSLGLAGGAELSVRLASFLGIFFRGGGEALSGVDADSFLSRGADSAYGGAGGLLVRVLRIEATGTQLALRGQVELAGGRQVDLRPLISNLGRSQLHTLTALSEGKVAGFLVTPTSSSGYGASVALAQSLLPGLSLQASAELGRDLTHQHPYDAALEARPDLAFRTVSRRLAAALTLDGAPLGLPLALMGEVRFSLHRTDDQTLHLTRSRASKEAALGLYYTGRADLQLGLVGVGQKGQEPLLGIDQSAILDADEVPRRLGGRFVFAYVW